LGLQKLTPSPGGKGKRNKKKKKKAPSLGAFGGRIKSIKKMPEGGKGRKKGKTSRGKIRNAIKRDVSRRAQG